MVADQRFAGNADLLTAFFGRFNVAFGVVALAAQILATGPLLRRFGMAATILLLPAALGAGSIFIVLVPGFWSVFVTNAADQTVRFSIDKASYELLYLPLAPAIRVRARNAIDVVRQPAGRRRRRRPARPGHARVRDGRRPRVRRARHGRDQPAVVGVWLAMAARLRREYVEAIRHSIRRHALRAGGPAGGPVLERAAAEVVAERLASSDTGEILYALDLVEGDPARAGHPALRALLGHESADVRRRALAVLTAGADASAVPEAEALLEDPDLEVRTEALLFLTRHQRIDPLEKVKELGDVAGFSIRSGMAAFLAHPGPAQNLEAARAILDAMAREDAGEDGARTRLEAVRLAERLGPGFDEPLASLVGDRDEGVAREAMRAAGAGRRLAVAPALVARAADAALRTEAAAALAAMGDAAVPLLRERLLDAATPLAVRREIPPILARIATPDAEQALLECLLHADAAMRHGVVAALARMRDAQPDLALDPSALDVLLLAEITGHYRSYQVLGALGDLDKGDQVVRALRQSMDREVERIFRLLSLLFPRQDIDHAYLGLRSTDPRISSNALELLGHVLKPQLRGLLLPLVDPHVAVAERAALANRLVGVPVSSLREALATLLDTEDSWLKSCAAYAVGSLQVGELRQALDRWAEHPDPLVRETVRAACARLDNRAEPAADAEAPPPLAPDVMGFG